MGLGQVHLRSKGIFPPWKAPAAAWRGPRKHKNHGRTSAGHRRLRPLNLPRRPAPPPVEAKVWSLDDGHERATLSGHNGEVVALDFSHDGKILATTSRAGVVKLWDTATFKPATTLTGRQGGVDLVLFSADDKTLVGANAAGLVTLWDVGSGKATRELQPLRRDEHDRPLARRQDPGNRRRPSREPGRRVSWRWPGPGGDVRIWDLATGRRLAVLPVPAGRVTRLAFAPDGKTLAAATEASSIMLWDIASSSPRGTMSWPSGRALYLAFAPDGKTLVAGGEDDVFRLWDAASGKLRQDPSRPRRRDRLDRLPARRPHRSYGQPRHDGQALECWVG